MKIQVSDPTYAEKQTHTHTHTHTHTMQGYFHSYANLITFTHYLINEAQGYYINRICFLSEGQKSQRNFHFSCDLVGLHVFVRVFCVRIINCGVTNQLDSLHSWRQNHVLEPKQNFSKTHAHTNNTSVQSLLFTTLTGIKQ